MNHKQLLPIGVGLGILALLVAGYFLYSMMQPKMDVSPNMPTPTPYATDIAHSVETLAKGGWQLERMTTIDGAVVEAPMPYEIAFSERRIAGEVCNLFSAAMNAEENGELSFGPVQSTKKMCEGAQMEIERHILAGLQTGMVFTIAPDSLHMTLSNAQSGYGFEFVWRE